MNSKISLCVRKYRSPGLTLPTMMIFPCGGKPGLTRIFKQNWIPRKSQRMTPVPAPRQALVLFFTLDGFHFHNNRRDPANSSGRFLDSRLLSRLNNLAPFGLQAAFTTVLSISNSEIPETSAENDDQDEQTRGLFGAIGGNRDEEEQEEENTVSQHTSFRVTLVWQPQKGTAPGGALSATTNP